MAEIFDSSDGRGSIRVRESEFHSGWTEHTRLLIVNEGANTESKSEIPSGHTHARVYATCPTVTKVYIGWEITDTASALSANSLLFEGRKWHTFPIPEGAVYIHCKGNHTFETSPTFHVHLVTG